jgi:hypothetical protein
MAHSPRGLLALVLFCLLAAAPAAGEGAESKAPANLSVEPSYIPIGLSYSGTTVQVRAEVPAGYDAAIRVMGKAETLEMKRKGKVGFVLWMSVGEVTFEAVPAVYILLTSSPLAQAASAAELGEWKLGYETLVRPGGSASGLYPELVKLKEKEGCFLMGEGHLARSGSARGDSTDGLTGSFRLPARAPVGEYTVDLFGFHEQRVIHLGSSVVRLEQTGLARVLRSAATEHGLIYGEVAVVVAVLAGLLTGFVFRPRKGMGK